LSPGFRLRRSRISLGTVSWPLLVMVAVAMLSSFPRALCPYRNLESKVPCRPWQ
jgi:hypothetical protein